MANGDHERNPQAQGLAAPSPDGKFTFDSSSFGCGVARLGKASLRRRHRGLLRGALDGRETVAGAT
jgi:hypothetical protein